MKHEFKNLPNSEAVIDVIVTFPELEPFLKKAASLISEEVEIEGFRKGKAPYEIVVKRVGEIRLYEKAANLAVEKFYPEVMKQLMEEKIDFTPIGRPAQSLGEARPIVPIGRPEITITKLAPKNDLEYKIKISFLPVFGLPDYKLIAKKITAARKEAVVLPEEIEKSLNWIADSRSTAIPVDRPIKLGDLVEVDFEVRKEGVLIEGGHSKNHPLVVGENRFVPGFEDAILGMRKDEKKSFDLKMPDDYREKSLAAPVLSFRVKVVSVKEKKSPELNDEFARSLGKFSSLEELKKSVKEGIISEKEAKESERLRLEIADKIASESDIDLPQVLVDAELDKMVAELKQGIENMGMKWEEYLAQIKKSEDDLRKDWLDQAARRVKIALCLAKIAKLEKIEPDGEEVRKEADRFSMRYVSMEVAKKNIDEEALLDYARNIVRNEKVFEFLETL